MPATQTQSLRFGQLGEIVDDLLQGVEPGPGALGFLTCDGGIDGAALAKAVQARVAFPVVGCTTLSFTLFADGAEASARLVVLRKPGLTVSVALSAPLRAGEMDRQMEAVYAEALAQSPNAVMLYALAPMMPGHVGEQYVNSLFRFAGALPLFGGMASADTDSERAAVFANGEAYEDRIVLVALGGAIRPVFAVGSQLSVMSEYAPTVTKSEGTTVYRVDEMSFVDYLRQLGFAPEGSSGGMDALFRFGPMPVLLRGKLPEDDGVPELRGIASVDMEAGSGGFTSAVPVGTRLSLGTLQKSDIVESAEACAHTLLARMAENERQGYRYDMLLCVPCVARYFTQVGGANLESRALAELLPKGMPATGFYSFCEFAPTLGENGEVHNRTHAESLVLAAL